MTAPADPKNAARAIDALRRGWVVQLCAAGEPLLCLLAVETADEASLAAFDAADAQGRAPLLIAHNRAATLNIVNQRAAWEGEADGTSVAPGGIWLDRAATPGIGFALATADPAQDLATPLKGPFRAIGAPAPQAAAMALTLARHARLLPAFFASAHSIAPPDATLGIADVAAYASPARLRLVARARLPVAAAETAEILAFRSAEDPAEHVALIIGEPDGTLPLVRLHSECLTGDVLGSLKCDCGPQLQHALRRIAQPGRHDDKDRENGDQSGSRGWGVLLYLRQEGRGIGLINKLRAYELQDQGFDTVDANLRLGFPVEARDFGIAAQMLRLMEIGAVRLLTNNPDKRAALEAQGIRVAERVAHQLPANAHNARYLATKRDRTGHQL